MDVFYLTILLPRSFGFPLRDPCREADTFPYRSKALSAMVSGAGSAEAVESEAASQSLSV